MVLNIDSKIYRLYEINTEHRTQYTKHRTQNTEHRTQNSVQAQYTPPILEHRNLLFYKIYLFEK